MQQSSSINPHSVSDFRVTAEQLNEARAFLAQIDSKSYVPPGVPIAPMPASRVAVSAAGRSLAGAAAPVAAPAVGTPADRELFKSWPWTAVGKVKCGYTDGSGKKVETHSGSGVLVSRWLMLTAGHVVPWHHMHNGNWWMDFYPAYYGGASKYGSSAVHWWWGIEDKTPFDDDVSDIAGRDYAVCALSKPLGSFCGWVGVYHLKESRYDDFVYTSIGYPGDVDDGETPCIETGLHILDIDNAGDGLELETRRYPAAPGWSGGPLWSHIDGQLRVVAVTTSPQKDFGFDPRRVMHSGGGLMIDIVRYGIAIFGAGPLTCSGDPFGYQGPAPHHVVYRATTGDIVERFINSAGQWAYNVISVAAGAPKAAASPRSYISAGSVHHVVYRAAKEIVELFVNHAGHWSHNILTTAAGAPKAASDPFGYVGPAPQHVIYRSTDNDIVELFIDGTGNWAFNIVNLSAGAPKAAPSAAPKAYITPGNGHHIVYRAVDNHVVELFVDSTGTWVYNLLTSAAGAPQAVSDPFGYVGPAPQHVVYRSVTNDIVELFIDGTGSWAFNIVNTSAGAPKAAPDASPRGYISAGNVHHIVYRSEGNQVIELFINAAGQWVYNVLTAAASAPEASGNPYGYVGPAPQHVVYRSGTNELVELYINKSGAWNFNIITAVP